MPIGTSCRYCIMVVGKCISLTNPGHHSIMLEYIEQLPILMALLIFCARVIDVSMGTVRSIMVFRGHRYIAAALGFIEVLIWVIAMGKVMQNLDVWYFAVAYAGGFATGNFVGMYIESKLAIGSELVRAVSGDLEIQLAESLRREGYSVTELAGTADLDRSVEVLLIDEKRRNVPRLLEAIMKIDPNAIWTISDVKSRPVSAQSLRMRAFAGFKLK